MASRNKIQELSVFALYQYLFYYSYEDRPSLKEIIESVFKRSKVQSFKYSEIFLMLSSAFLIANFIRFLANSSHSLLEHSNTLSIISFKEGLSSYE